MLGKTYALLRFGEEFETIPQIQLIDMIGWCNFGERFEDAPSMLEKSLSESSLICALNVNAVFNC